MKKYLIFLLVLLLAIGAVSATGGFEDMLNELDSFAELDVNFTDSDTNLESSAKYSVTSVTDIKKEQYYLSIFTKADDSTTNIYRYEISSPESFGSTGTGVMTSGTWIVNDWRSNRIDKNTVINLFTGKLYENNLTLNVTPRSSGTPVMSATNNYLTVDMKATVSLTSSAVSSGVGVNMLTFQNNADIYQTFLMMI